MFKYDLVYRKCNTHTVLVPPVTNEVALRHAAHNI